MPHKKWIALGFVIAMGVGLLPPLNSRAAPAAQSNLLTNPGFEGSFTTSDAQTSVGQGWSPWWIPRPPGQPDWSFNHPNFIASQPCGEVCDHRIHSGGNAQRLFQFFGTYVAGLYQRVNVTPGSDVQFSAFGQSWSSQMEQPQNVSNGGTQMHLKVGIDPAGGTDPLDPRVIWSGEADALDSWQQFQVYARAQGSTVTVFMYAAPDDARRKNEVYWDDASLQVLSGALAATAEATYPTPTSVPVTVEPTPISVALGQNLLQDGGFEGSLYIPCSRANDVPWNQISCDGLDFSRVNGQRQYIRWDTVQVPLGWKGWWLAPNTNHAGDPKFYQNHPNNCYDDAPEGCIAWHNPEFRDTKGVVLGPSRIHSGSDSQKYFTFWSVHEAGVMQTVAVPPGTTLRFGAWMQAWSTNSDGREEIPGSYVSSGQTSMHMKVGIDPCGGEDPWSPNIVWGPEHDSYDVFGYYEVRATAQCDKVTVFTHSMPEKALKHNDVYVDDAELVAIDASGAPVAIAPQPQPIQSQPAAAPSNSLPAVVNSAPQPTALPRPDGAIVHVVKAGDTVFGLSLQYDVPMDQILQLNGLTKDSFIHIGQELVISAPPPTAPAPQPTAPEAAAAASVTSPTPEQAALANKPSKALLCVRAFDDVNGDGVFVAGDALVQGATFHIATSTGQPIASYTSDGLSEPHCFTRLPLGTYSVSIDPAPGTAAVSDQRWGVALDKGTIINVNFGSKQAVTAAAASSSPSDDVGSLIGLAFSVSAAGVVGWLVYRKRQGTSAAGS